MSAQNAGNFVIDGVPGQRIVDLSSSVDYPWSEMGVIEGGENIALKGYPFGDSEVDCPKFNGGDWLRSLSANYGDVGDNDMCIDIFVDLKSGIGLNSLLSKNYITYKLSYYLYNSNTNYLFLGLYSMPVERYVNCAVSQNSINFISICFDRDGLARVFINGSQAGSFDISIYEETFDDWYFQLGKIHGYDTGNHAILSVVSEIGNNWISSGVQDEFYRHFCLISSIWPMTAMGAYLPTVRTRTGSAYSEMKLAGYDNPKLFMMGGNFLRIEYNSDYADHGWFRAEPQRTNYCPYSEDFTNWTPTRCTFSSNAVECPDGRVVADGIIASVDNDDHYVELAISVADGTWHCYSVFLKPGNKDWVKLVWQRGSEAQKVYAYIDLANGVVGERFGGISVLVDKIYYGDFLRVLMVVQSDNPDILRIFPVNGDLDDDFVGDAATVNTYVWGVQAEPGYWMTSQIPTSGAIATRTADVLAYKGDDGNIPSSGHGRLSFDFAWPYLWYTEECWSAEQTLVAISDGGSSLNCIRAFLPAGEPSLLRCQIVADSVAVNLDIDLASEEPYGMEGKHTIDIYWDTDYFCVGFDGYLQEPVVATVPDELDRIDVGNMNGSGQSGFLLANIKLSKWSAPSP
ncbi:MAG: hypothetical protein A2Y72_03275 [Chloroflexi bacterium RBG_13_53_26]|nr:MAG: hypothetical protein A2Y72_03275 [Chloroflexi bacterium RBG_13_53_26]